LTRCNAGINIAIKRAIMAITTSSSISVKPFIRAIVFSDEFQLGTANPPKLLNFTILPYTFSGHLSSQFLFFWAVQAFSIKPLTGFHFLTNISP
jgi:hypothetical protein